MPARRLADERVGEVRDHGCGCRGGIRALLGRLGDGAHEARADDHAVGSGVRGGGRLLAACEMPNPSATGTAAVRLDPRPAAPPRRRCAARSPVVPVTETV